MVKVLVVMVMMNALIMSMVKMMLVCVFWCDYESAETLLIEVKMKIIC